MFKFWSKMFIRTGKNALPVPEPEFRSIYGEDNTTSNDDIFYLVSLTHFGNVLIKSLYHLKILSM